MVTSSQSTAICRVKGVVKRTWGDFYLFLESSACSKRNHSNAILYIRTNILSSWHNTIITDNIVVAGRVFMAGKASLRCSFGDAACQRHSIRIFHRFAVGCIVYPEPILIVWVISVLMLKHYRDRLPVLHRIIRDDCFVYTLATIFRLHDDYAFGPISGCCPYAGETR